MNARWMFSLVACTVVLLFGAQLATAAEPNIGQDQSAMQVSVGIIRASTLTGMTVLNQQSQKLGQIKDVLLDPKSGLATFVALDAEVPQSGHAMLVVPFQALRMSVNPTDNRLSVALDLRPDQVRIAPQIQNNQWQMLQNSQFLEQARNFYKPMTYTAARPIDNTSPAAPLPQPRACPVLPPCTDSGGSYSGWPQSLIDFSSE